MKISLKKVKLLAALAATISYPGVAQTQQPTKAVTPTPQTIAPTTSDQQLAMSKAIKNKVMVDNTLSPAEKKAGYTLLFDGKTINQWRGFRKETVPDSWGVQEGAIALVGKGGGDLVTKNQYENYEFLVDWKISEGGNSGIIYNVSEDPQYQATYHTGPEMQVLDNERHPDAKQGKNGNRQAGANYDMIPVATPAVKPVGQWNSVKLVVNKGHVEHWLNGKKVVEYQLGSPEWEALVKESKFAAMPGYGKIKKGHIALQDHGDKVWFKNLKIRQL
ncbi:3-keto-disaccharide hydrolase [Adhaeribacter pallidiroseus]|uniref:3-keto-alpha-glucoside-1,2-lyase/3-keto-2-hydroxy-glucal hydratase domain-containing protein n=1 Tax=Adhaeribacter pallidiroseus TaxID=2072847 RepID=A0A369QFL9_9BACT|nr:DUF1080 domain-containing protein [Adhaeribacter pallidiroseus]RDC61689.1 hypothetical protein AHMF7616_00269 [Adhaeribacter pallidiroseus]